MSRHHHFLWEERVCFGLQMTVLLIPDFLSVLIVAFTVLLIDLCLFGFMTLWGLRLNLITMVNLLLAIGKSIKNGLPAHGHQMKRKRMHSKFSGSRFHETSC